MAVLSSFAVSRYVCIFSCPFSVVFFFFFNDTATTEIYTLSLHDALPISLRRRRAGLRPRQPARGGGQPGSRRARAGRRGAPAPTSSLRRELLGSMGDHEIGRAHV